MLYKGLAADLGLNDFIAGSSASQDLEQLLYNRKRIPFLQKGSLVIKQIFMAEIFIVAILLIYDNNN